MASGGHGGLWAWRTFAVASCGRGPVRRRLWRGRAEEFGGQAAAMADDGRGWAAIMVAGGYDGLRPRRKTAMAGGSRVGRRPSFRGGRHGPMAVTGGRGAAERLWRGGTTMPSGDPCLFTSISSSNSSVFSKFDLVLLSVLRTPMAALINALSSDIFSFTQALPLALPSGITAVP